MAEKKLRMRKSLRYDDETIYAAKFLYLKKHTPKEIAAELGLNSTRPIYYWAEKYNWRNLISESGIEELIALRIVALTEREGKSENEIKELNALIDKDLEYKKLRANQQAKQAKQQAVNFGESFTNFADSGDGSDKGDKKQKKKKVKNDISHITPEMFQPFVDSLFDYQKHARANKHQDVRNILKSRQIGMTYYFSFEGFEDAVLTGDNQIFLSASKRQSEIFKNYIVKMARQYFDVELKGNPIILSNGAELHFLATNANTAQGNSGHVYGDEYAWIRDFDRFHDVSSAMATHEKWRETYFSTPSSKFHPSYAFWSGDKWKSDDPKRKNVIFPTFAEYRDGGRICPDGVWRYVVTIEDAEKGGCDLFNIEKLKQKYNRHVFNQLFMCVWIDDANSIFKISELLKCGVDTATWKDFEPGAEHPFGMREVWAGYDPAHSQDAACFVIVAPPVLPKEKFRLLERHQWHGLSYKWQAQQIKGLFEKYNITYLGIDATGVGYGVYEEVKEFARREAVPLNYNPEVKTGMVLKMHDLVISENIAWSNKEIDIAASFLMVKQTTTRSGEKTTFIAERTAQNQHADVFWAMCNAINKKSLTTKKRRSSWGI